MINKERCFIYNILLWFWVGVLVIILVYFQHFQEKKNGPLLCSVLSDRLLNISYMGIYKSIMCVSLVKKSQNLLKLYRWKYTIAVWGQDYPCNIWRYFEILTMLKGPTSNKSFTSNELPYQHFRIFPITCSYIKYQNAADQVCCMFDSVTCLFNHLLVYC